MYTRSAIGVQRRRVRKRLIVVKVSISFYLLHGKRAPGPWRKSRICSLPLLACRFPGRCKKNRTARNLQGRMSLPEKYMTEKKCCLFGKGADYQCYGRLGSPPGTQNGGTGFHFAVWVPDVKNVWMCGSFNGWNMREYRMEPVGSSGIREGFVPGAQTGGLCNYVIEPQRGEIFYKADPFAFATGKPPATASMLFDRSCQSRLQYRRNRGKQHPVPWRTGGTGCARPEQHRYAADACPQRCAFGKGNNR